MAEVINTIGRRKTAVARIYMTPGNGTIMVNGRDYKEYFPTGPLQYIVGQAFAVANAEGKWDVKANLDGGGITGLIYFYIKDIRFYVLNFFKS